MEFVAITLVVGGVAYVVKTRLGKTKEATIDIPLKPTMVISQRDEIDVRRMRARKMGGVAIDDLTNIYSAKGVSKTK